MRLPALGLLAALFACDGPPAPDDALCRDVIYRMCLARTCPGVDEQLALGTGDCNDTLRERTGCWQEDFTFSTPSRERVLSCRLPLVSQSTDPNKPPLCSDVAVMMEACPDLMGFLRGGQP